MNREEVDKGSGNHTYARLVLLDSGPEEVRIALLKQERVKKRDQGLLEVWRKWLEAVGSQVPQPCKRTLLA